METVTLEFKQDFDSLINKFAEDCKLRGMTKESIRRYKSSLNTYANYFTHANLIDVNMEF